MRYSEWQVARLESICKPYWSVPFIYNSLVSIDTNLRDGWLGFTPLQTGCGAHSASYPLGTGVSHPEGKAIGAWSKPLTFIYSCS